MGEFAERIVPVDYMVGNGDDVETSLTENIDGPSQLNRAVRIRCVNVEVTQEHCKVVQLTVLSYCIYGKGFSLQDYETAVTLRLNVKR
jgi:hypothetical protein